MKNTGCPAQSRLRQEIEALRPWFHNLHLPDGTQTAPDHGLGDFPAYKWNEIGTCLPEDLSGWSALDIGCNAGYYSFELARRGAHVTAIDSHPHYLAQARWALAQYRVDSRIRFLKMQVYDLARLEARYDLVLFLGVFYHLRYPLLALDLVARKVKRVLFFQTLSLPGDEVAADAGRHDLDDRDHMLQPGWPKMAFIEGSFADDPTNWWVPNQACIRALLRSAGLEILATPGKETYFCHPAPCVPPFKELWEEQYAALVRSAKPRKRT